MSTSDLRTELLEEYRQTTVERLDRITVLWIRLESGANDPGAREELLRELHTLKGEAKMMEFPEVSSVAHRTEDLVLAATARSSWPRTVGNAVLMAVDAIRALNDDERAASIDLPDLMASFDAALQPEKEEAPQAVRSERAPTPESTAEPGRYIRVDLDRVSQLSEAVSESVISYGRLEHLARALEELAERTSELVAHGSSPELAIIGADLNALSKSLNQEVYEGSLRARDLDHRARALRLVSVREVLNRNVRIVRDLLRDQQKRVRVEIVEAAVVLDKHVIEKISDPLVHLVRNAVDHGIENAVERTAAGKSAEGCITLSAKYDGSFVEIRVADDGRGIDLDATRRRAVEMRILAEDAAQALGEEEALALLFRPGFSTRTVVTETSGRGVGLDVVKREVELLGGTVRVRSTPGAGTRFELRVPVSVALTRVLVFRCRGETYAVPAAAVDGVSEVTAGELEYVNNRRAFRFRGALERLVSLAEVFGGSDHERSTRALLIRHDEVRMGFLVSEWEKDIDVVVKPLGMLLERSRIIAGACALPDGRIALVLNPAELLRQASGQGPRAEQAPAEEGPRARRYRVLLVEDSAITRSIIGRVLRSLGHEVQEAENGRVAWDLLGAGAPDLVLTDLDMPEMNGFELIRRVRKERKLSRLPIVVLSTRGSDRDKRTAAEAGADAYLVKNDFSEAALQEIIGRQLGAR